MTEPRVTEARHVLSEKAFSLNEFSLMELALVRNGADPEEIKYQVEEKDGVSYLCASVST